VPEREQKVAKGTKALPLFVSLVCFCSKKVFVVAANWPGANPQKSERRTAPAEPSAGVPVRRKLDKVLGGVLRRGRQNFIFPGPTLLLLDPFTTYCARCYVAA